MEMPHARYLSQALPKRSGAGALLPWGGAVWLPWEGEGETRSHRSSCGAISTVNQFTCDVYWLDPPGNLPWLPQGPRIV